MQVLTDFLTSWYGVAVALGAALSLFWGIAKAVGALRSWLHKRYTERQEQLASPKKLLDAIAALRTELVAQNEEQNRKIAALGEEVRRVEEAIDNNNDQVATLQLKELNWAYIYYGIKHHPLPLHSKNSLEQMYEQYTTGSKHNHVPADWREKINSCPLEGEKGE